MRRKKKSLGGGGQASGTKIFLKRYHLSHNGGASKKQVGVHKQGACKR